MLGKQICREDAVVHLPGSDPFRIVRVISSRARQPCRRSSGTRNPSTYHIRAWQAWSRICIFAPPPENGHRKTTVRFASWFWSDYVCMKVYQRLLAKRSLLLWFLLGVKFPTKPFKNFKIPSAFFITDFKFTNHHRFWNIHSQVSFLFFFSEIHRASSNKILYTPSAYVFSRTRNSEFLSYSTSDSSELYRRMSCPFSASIMNILTVGISE